MKSHRSYFDEVELKLRPIIPFINRSKFPRVVRQRYLDRLVGQHLALAATKTDPPTHPRQVAANKDLVAEVIEYAKKQESELFDRSSNQVQVYQNLAARESALDYVLEANALRGQQAAYKAVLAAGRLWDKMAESKKRDTMTTGNDQFTAKKKKKLETQQLQEADLDWDVNHTAVSSGNGISDEDRKYIKQQVIKDLEQRKEWALLSIEERIDIVEKYMSKVTSEIVASEISSPGDRVGSSKFLTWQQAVQKVVKTMLHGEK